MTQSSKFLLLLHQIPPKPPYLRAKILRRLSQVGALPIKNSAYLLPENEDTLEDFEWIRQEIAREGGAAWIFRAESVSGASAEQIEEAFRQLHASEYETLIEQCRESLSNLESAPGEGLALYRKIARRAYELHQLDYFGNPRRSELDKYLTQLEEKIRARESSAVIDSAAATGRVWVTRQGVKVDRIASAWLIRRFIDPRAVIHFVDPTAYTHAPDEIRFDMYEGEFTHRGESCTFEVLVESHGLQSDPGLIAIGEIVHDIDLKDRRFQREETGGVSRLIDGLCLEVSADDQRIERGGLIFESLYRSFPSGAG